MRFSDKPVSDKLGVTVVKYWCMWDSSGEGMHKISLHASCTNG